MATRGLEGVAEQAPVLGQQWSILRAELLEQARRALEVGEKQRDRARRQVRPRCRPRGRLVTTTDLLIRRRMRELFQ